MKKGEYLFVATTTKDDVFGDVLYEIVETGLPAPEKGREAKDGIKCVIVAGTGPAARPGYSVIDSEATVNRNIKEGVTQLLSPEQGKIKAETLKASNDPLQQAKTGVIELD